MHLTYYLGEMAALATSFCWSFGSTFFTLSSRMIGSHTVNRVRLVIALFLIMILHLIVYGQLMPTNMTPARWFWFGLSGIIGFSIGDTLLFRAFFLIGARLSMLMMSLTPVFSTLIAWLFLGEILRPVQITAIAITLVGVTWVIREREEGDIGNKNYVAGILCGLGGALGQALGLILSKKGLIDGFSPFSGNLIRVLFAVLSLWLLTALSGRVKSTFQRLSNTKALKFLCGGVIFGPFLGVWLSLVAVQNTYVGIATTLMALPPIILIPLSYWFFKEKITPGAVIGTIVALFGVALLFLA